MISMQLNQTFIYRGQSRESLVLESMIAVSLLPRVSVLEGPDSLAALLLLSQDILFSHADCKGQSCNYWSV